MIDSIAKATKRWTPKRGPTVVTAETPFPVGTSAAGAFDGSVSGGNPGLIGVGYWFDSEKGRIVRAGGTMGRGTNNEAEYHAFILAMRHALRLGVWSLKLVTDSELIQRQMEGRYKVKSGRLKRLNAEAQTLRGLFHSFQLWHVDRSFNEEADYLSRQIVYEEAYLPPPPKGSGGHVKVLHEFQAAAIRSWGLRKRAGVGVMQRIFMCKHTLVDLIVQGKAYRDAAFNMPSLEAGLLIDAVPPLVGEWRDVQIEIDPAVLHQPKEPDATA